MQPIHDIEGSEAHRIHAERGNLGQGFAERGMNPQGPSLFGFVAVNRVVWHRRPVQVKEPISRPGIPSRGHEYPEHPESAARIGLRKNAPDTKLAELIHHVTGHGGSAEWTFEG